MQLNISNDKLIDKYNLDTENARLPGLVYDYSAALAEEEKELTFLQNKLKVDYAKKAYDIQLAGKTPHGVKATRDVVDGYVSMDYEIIGLEESIAAQQHKVKLHKAALEAILHKKTSLSNLVRLQTMDYFNKAPYSGMNKQEDILNSLNEQLDN